MYKTAKRTCSLKDKSFRLTVTERLRIAIGMNYSGSTVSVISLRVTTTEYSGNVTK